MNRAPLLLGAAVVFWGWQCGTLEIAVLMAATLEGARLVKVRWDFDDRSFDRISDLSALLLLGVAVYQFDEHSFHAIFPILKAVPFVLFPLALAQRYSTRDRVSYAALFLSVRRALRKGRIETVDAIDVQYPFFLACLVSASAGRGEPAAFFPGLALLVAWGLATHRPPGRSPSIWAAALIAAIGFSFLTQLGMVQARRAVEPLLMQLLHERIWSRRDPYRAQTALGEIGRLKQSQRIIARVRVADGGRAPERLIETVYRSYSRHLWLAPGVSFEEIEARGGGTVWDLHGPRETPPRPRWLAVSSALFQGRGVIMLPAGAYQVEGLNVDEVTRNELGVVKVNRGPELVEFTARYTDARSFVQPPDANDLAIPRDQRRLFDGLAADLGMQSSRDEQGTVAWPAAPEAVAAVRGYFGRGFRYSLERRRIGVFSTPLEDFIRRTRAGHCEYFATATVLLLRAAGVPARYASGYGLQEWSPLEDAYVVRRRHAHSWAIAYVDGRWQDVDTTPAVWAAEESAESPWWLGGYDVLAWLRFKFTQWRYDDSDWIEAQTLVGAALVLSLVLAWRLSRTTRRVRRARPIAGPSGPWPGEDSEAYAVMRLLGRGGGGARRPGETLTTWRQRLAEHRGLRAPARLVDEVLTLHRRYRFDPRGLGLEDRERLREAAGRWLRLETLRPRGSDGNAIGKESEGGSG